MLKEINDLDEHILEALRHFNINTDEFMIPVKTKKIPSEMVMFNTINGASYSEERFSGYTLVSNDKGVPLYYIVIEKNTKNRLITTRYILQLYMFGITQSFTMHDSAQFVGMSDLKIHERITKRFLNRKYYGKYVIHDDTKRMINDDYTLRFSREGERISREKIISSFIDKDVYQRTTTKTDAFTIFQWFHVCIDMGTLPRKSDIDTILTVKNLKNL